MKQLLMIAAGALLLASCASQGWPSKADPTALKVAPSQFLAVDATTGATSPVTGPECRNPLADPGDGMRLTLMRSAGGFGDYALERPRYGLRADQLLRVDCHSGRAVGATRAPR